MCPELVDGHPLRQAQRPQRVSNQRRTKRFGGPFALKLEVVVDIFIYPPVHWSIQTRQFAKTKQLAEHDSSQGSKGLSPGAEAR